MKGMDIDDQNGSQECYAPFNDVSFDCILRKDCHEPFCTVREERSYKVR
jgi:hypothetical protein